MKVDFLKKLTHLKLEDKSIAKIQALEACEKVRVLYLFDNCIRRIENLSFARSLTHLYLQNNQITKIEGLETLGNLTKLCAPRPAPLPAGRGSVALPRRPSSLPRLKLDVLPRAGTSMATPSTAWRGWMRSPVRPSPSSLAHPARGRAAEPGCAQGSRS